MLYSTGAITMLVYSKKSIGAAGASDANSIKKLNVIQYSIDRVVIFKKLFLDRIVELSTLLCDT